MTQKVLMYFRTENDAETVRTKLNTLKASQIMIDSMPEAAQENTRLFVENDPTYTAGAGESTNTSGTTEPITEGGDNLDDIEDRGESNITTMLSFEVEDEHYDTVMDALHEFNYFKEPDARS